MTTFTGIADLADAALINIGLFVEPDEITVPQDSVYQYPIQETINVKSIDVSLFYSKIGADIFSSRGRVFTSLQSKRVEFFTKAMTFDLISLTPMLLISGVVSTAVSCILFGGITFHYMSKLFHSFQKYDLDKPEVRKEVMERIRNWTFEDILEKFSLDEIVKYDLFEIKLSGHDKHLRAEFYAKLAKLSLDRTDLEIAKNADLLEISRCYSEGTEKINAWMDICKAKVSQINWKYIKPELFPLEQAPSEFEKTLSKVVKLSVEWRLQEKMKPWIEWKAKEISGVEKAYQMALLKLESIYRNILLVPNEISLFYSNYLERSKVS